MATILVVVAAGRQSRGERGRQLPARARDWRAGIDPGNAAPRAANHLWPVARFMEAIFAGAGNATGRARIFDANRAAGSMVLALGILCWARRGRGGPGCVHIRDAAGRRAVFFPVAKALPDGLGGDDRRVCGIAVGRHASLFVFVAGGYGGWLFLVSFVLLAGCGAYGQPPFLRPRVSNRFSFDCFYLVVSQPAPLEICACSMTVFPIADRGFRVASRRPGTY